jgi:hypothetical protein
MPMRIVEPSDFAMSREKDAMKRDWNDEGGPS